jgi:hypothetical protein
LQHIETARCQRPTCALNLSNLLRIEQPVVCILEIVPVPIPQPLKLVKDGRVKQLPNVRIAKVRLCEASNVGVYVVDVAAVELLQLCC